MSEETKYPGRLSIDLTPQQRADLEELKRLSGARSYVQTVTEALQRSLNVERDRKIREDRRRVHARNTMTEL